ncbi:hypothetical protein RB595_002166 [Gaeumannomyces hyphopodioides]
MDMMLRSLVTIGSTRAPQPQEPDRPPALPERVASKDGRQRPAPIELETFTPGPPPVDAQAAPRDAANRDLEMRRQTTPQGSSGGGFTTEVQATVWEPYMNRFRMAAVSITFFSLGLYDSAAGALIPYMEKHHSIGYAVVSLVFVGNALGFIAGAPFIDSLRRRVGHAGVLALAQLAMVCGHVPIVCSPKTPFAVVVVSFFLIGFGMTFTLAMSNTFCAALRSGTALLGVLHGSYGVGGTVGPLMATAIVTRSGANAETGERAEIWSRFYLIPLGLAVFNGFFGYWAFRGYEADSPHPSNDSNNTSSSAALAGTLRNRVVLLGSLFIFAYQGAEVSISGWVISFLIAARGGDPASVGYVTSGFWAGITLGRLLLSGPGASRFGERRFVYALAVGAAVFEALVWAVPNIIGNAVSVAFVGLLLGPIYPCAVALFMRSMDRAERFGGLGVITAFGSSGGAAAPFTTGLLAQLAGTFVLHPVVIVLVGVMLLCWWGVPKEEKRTE